jgi:hypothetical protein
VLTGSSVTAGVSTGGGVASSANTLIGKMRATINDKKMIAEITVGFFVCFIVEPPSPPD